MVATRPLSDLRDDNRGAIMLIGLFMACFLIGSLWFIVGVGDAIVYRDRMQEATDHGAFAASAMNAKGMNFISLCNLVLLVAVTIHIVLGIIHDIALALCIISFGTTCGFWEGVRELWINYFDILKPAARAIHNATKIGSYGFPVMGLAEGLAVGKSYKGGKSNKPLVIALSPSLLSGMSFTSSEKGAEKKEGLTLEPQPMWLVCRRVASLSIDTLFKTALGVSGRGFAGKVMDLAKKILGDVIENRYCNDLSNKERFTASQRVDQFLQEGLDNIGKSRTGRIARRVILGDTSGGGGLGGGGGGGGTTTNDTTTNSSSSGGSIDPGFDKFWGENGPMVVIGPAKNGNDWFQTYSVNLNLQMTDSSESRVRVSAGPSKGGGKLEVKVKPLGGFYFAQAEYYFDCARKWSTEGCNFEGNSTFAIKWRARLRRFSIPSLKGYLMGMGQSYLESVPQYQQFKQLQGKFDMYKDLFEDGVAKMGQIRSFLDNAGKNTEDALKDALEDEAKDAVDEWLNTPFH